jgi:quercetin dioxygenase-like cupin family protein
VSGFEDLAAIAPQRIWENVTGRVVEGERLTMGIVELAPDSHVPEHHHANEQLGMVLTGSVTFRIADETRQLGPGGTWRIASDVPHEVRAGPRGAVVIDVFAPTRDDWRESEREEPRAPLWPGPAGPGPEPPDPLPGP